jgi:hypothetical protein
MKQHAKRPSEPGADLPRPGSRLAQALLIVAIMVLIAVALVTFR